MTTITLHTTWTLTGTVDDIYRPGPITAATHDSLEQTAARLQDKDISALVIMDGYRLAGIITERDIVRAVADWRIGLPLPCNVVVRTDRDETVVEALDQQVMVGVSGQSALEPVADDAARRLAAALDTLGS